MIDSFKFLFLQCDETRKLMNNMFFAPTSTTANFSRLQFYGLCYWTVTQCLNKTAYICLYKHTYCQTCTKDGHQTNSFVSYCCSHPNNTWPVLLAIYIQLIYIITSWMWLFLFMTQDKLMLTYNSKILTNMYGTRVISDQCLRIILTILLCPYMISTGITQPAYVKFNGYCPLHILYIH